MAKNYINNTINILTNINYLNFIVMMQLFEIFAKLIY